MDVFTQAPASAPTMTTDDGGDDDLHRLVDGVQSGKPAAVEQLMARVQHRVREWAAKFTRDTDAADDVTQDVLIDLERRVQRFRGDSRFSTWLFAVTRNVALSRAKREHRRAALLERRVSLADRPAESEARDLDAAALGTLVLRYFDALPRRQRQIFELSDIRGWTPAEIAQELGMEATTVRVHLFKARQTIRARIVEHHGRLLEEYRS